MTRRANRKSTTTTAAPTDVGGKSTGTPGPDRPTNLKRGTVLLSDADLTAVLTSPNGVTVTAYRPITRSSDAQRAYRTAYAKRPDVKAKRRAYLAKRRAAKRAATTRSTASEQPA